MTDPVILLGTQSNGETLPVQVNSFGQLVAEGLEGSEGPQGPQGPQGPEGPQGPAGQDGTPGIQLPPDPYEGALLGWLNDELAWIGTPPVPIPPGVFGPITSWSPNDGFLTVEGEIPASVGNGVYIWQCNADGTYFTEGWNTTQVWSDSSTLPNKYSFFAYTEWSRFAANGATYVITNYGKPASTIGFEYETSGTSEVIVYYLEGPPQTIALPNNERETRQTFDVDNTKTIDEVTIRHTSGPDMGFYAVFFDDKKLIDSDKSLNLRVNQVLGQNLIGVPSATVDFTIGKYLRVPEQRVAPWVLYGNDPTSLIDHLRSS